MRFQAIFNHVFRSQEKDRFMLTLLVRRNENNTPEYRIRSNLPVGFIYMQYPVIEQYITGLQLIPEQEFVSLLKTAGRELLGNPLSRHFFYPASVLDEFGYLCKSRLDDFHIRLQSFKRETPRTVTWNKDPEPCEFLNEIYWKAKLVKEGAYKTTSVPRTLYEKELAGTELALEYVNQFRELKRFSAIEGTESSFYCMVALNESGKVIQAIILRTYFVNAERN